jgi:transcriptional regulator NrdR family protein
MNCPVCSTKAKVSSVWKNKRHQTRVYLCPECLTEFRTKEKVEEAIVTPPNYGKYTKWKEVAKANGIALPTFYTRINVNGWTAEKAATTPLLKKGRAMEIKVESPHNSWF